LLADAAMIACELRRRRIGMNHVVIADMRKHHKTRKLNISADTIRNLGSAELSQAIGGAIQTRQGCTHKNSNCNACPELEI